MSNGPELIRPVETPERNWMPLIIAASAVIVIAAALVLVLQRGHKSSSVASIDAPTDPYAAHLALSNIAMSEASNMVGGKVTYLDGRITNNGDRTITGITMQVLFRNVAHEVAQNETQEVRLIRTREPYIDIQSINSDPIKPGETREFRLSFDTVTQDWDGVYPQLRILKVETR